MNKNLLNSETACFLIVDIQDAFRKSIAGLDSVVKNTLAAARGFEILARPILITEQYPKGLGHTVDKINSGLSEAIYFEKSTFSALGAEGIEAHLQGPGISQVAVAGIETHVCVNQSVQDLLSAGFEVHILEDAVDSRNSSDRDSALKKLYSLGAVPSSVEMALFEMLRDSKNPYFKEIQSLIK